MPDFDANDDIALPGSGTGEARAQERFLAPLVRRARDLAFPHPRPRRAHHERIDADALSRRRRQARRACHGDGRAWAVGTFSPPQGRLRSRCHPRHPAPGHLS